MAASCSQFIVDVLPDKMPELQAAGLEAKLKLSTRISTGKLRIFISIPVLLQTCAVARLQAT